MTHRRTQGSDHAASTAASVGCIDRQPAPGARNRLGPRTRHAEVLGNHVFGCLGVLRLRRMHLGPTARGCERYPIYP